jgi:3-methyladenine DNA glycosylase AlkD
MAVRVGRAVSRDVSRLLARSADSSKVEAMSKYMRLAEHARPSEHFLGVPGPARKQALKEALAQQAEPAGAGASQRSRTVRDAVKADVEAWEVGILELWKSDVREAQYLALMLVNEFPVHWRSSRALPLLEKIIREAKWWDTLDTAAASMSRATLSQRQSKPTAAQRAKTQAEQEQIFIAWRTDSELWVRRASLLVHLFHKEHTNIDLLTTTIDLLAHEQDFFIRKAIGWILRQYARTDADFVRAFVAERTETLSKLSQREALKNLGGLPSPSAADAPKKRKTTKDGGKSSSSGKASLDEGVGDDEPRTSKRRRSSTS